MGRLLFIKSIEARVLAGITMFVGMMILVGWVAINEEAADASLRAAAYWSID